MKKTWLYVLMVGWSGIAPGATAEQESRLAHLMHDEKARAAAVAEGREAARFCENCHGSNGISVHDHIPNLAGQHVFYLLTQIEKFGDGRRQHDFMSGLVKAIKPEDRFNIAVFYASQEVEPRAVKDMRKVEAGRALYQRSCMGCHGPEGRGSREVARLAGQQPVYVLKALKDYRAARGLRTDPRMTGVAKGLSDAQIEALAAYVASMR